MNVNGWEVIIRCGESGVEIGVGTKSQWGVPTAMRIKHDARGAQRKRHLHSEVGTESDAEK